MEWTEEPRNPHWAIHGQEITGEVILWPLYTTDSTLTADGFPILFQKCYNKPKVQSFSNMYNI